MNARVAQGLAGVSLVALAVAAVLGWTSRARLADDLARRDRARVVAEEVVTSLLTYDHDDPGASRAAAASLLTDDFASTWDEAMAGGLQEEIASSRASATATVRRVMLGELDGADLRAVVVVDTSIDSDTGTRRRSGAYLELALVEQADAWRVDALTDLGVSDGEPGPS